MKDTPDQVARVTRELRALLAKLHWGAFQSASGDDQDLILNGLLNASLVEDLRMTVDHLSHFLWCYVESAAANSDPQPDYQIQGKRLGQIAEMLRLLHGPACPTENPLAFVERVTRSVDRHMETASQETQSIRGAPGALDADPFLRQPKLTRYRTSFFTAGRDTR